MNDLISRQEVKEILRTEWIKLFPVELDPYLSLALEKIENIPSAEPKKGRWIRNDNGTYSCSVCQSWIPEEQHYYARYCLYCGAKIEAIE